MRAITRLFGLAAAGVLITGAAQAQTCRGYSSLDTKHMNAAAKAFFGNDASLFGAQLNMRHVGFGQNHFVGLGIATESFDGGGSALVLNGDLGIEFKTASDLEWCPMAGIDFSKFDGEKNHDIDLNIGLGVGKAVGNTSGSVQFVPFGHVSFVHARYTRSGFTGSDNAFDFGAGVGLRFNNGMQISPQVSKSTFDGTDPVFGATVSFPFGHGM
jgi:hypothetical protein